MTGVQTCALPICVNGAPDTRQWGAREVGFIDFQFQDGAFEHRIVGPDFLFRHEGYVRKLARAAS